MDIYIIKSMPVKKLTPSAYYRKMQQAYIAELEKDNRCHFWCMSTVCDNAAREMYSQMTGRRPNITDLVTTKEEADQLFEYFKIYANVWSYQMTCGESKTVSEKEQQINRIAGVLRSANANQLMEVDIFIRSFVQ